MSLAREAGVNLEFINHELLPALKSGEYKQGFGRLRANEEEIDFRPLGPPRSNEEEKRMCCLGVACDVKDKEGWVVVRSTYNQFHWTHQLSDSGGLVLRDLDWLFGTMPQQILSIINDYGQEMKPAYDYEHVIIVLEHLENDLLYNDLTREFSKITIPNTNNEKVYEKFGAIVENLQKGVYDEQSI